MVDEPTKARPFISACMLTYNDSGTIARAIGSVRPHVDEIVVYDTGSRDGTLDLLAAIAATPGAPLRVYRAGDELRPSLYPDGAISDLARARNISFALASPAAEWLLWLDPDEVVVAGANLHELAMSQPLCVDGLQIDHATSGCPRGRRRPRLARRGRLTWRYRMNEQLRPAAWQIGDDYDTERRLPAVDGDQFRVVHMPANEEGHSDQWKLRVMRDMEREALERDQEPDGHTLFWLARGLEPSDPLAAFQYLVRASASSYAFMAIPELQRLLHDGGFDPWFVRLVDYLSAQLCPLPVVKARLAESLAETGSLGQAQRVAKEVLASASDDWDELGSQRTDAEIDGLLSRLKMIAADG